MVLAENQNILIDQFVGFSFNTVVEAHWLSGSARHQVSFADWKPRAPEPLFVPFLSDNSGLTQTRGEHGETRQCVLGRKHWVLTGPIR